MDNNIFKDFTKYVSLNILGMIGLSCYILADTFFISKALGSTGVAALNFSISIYSLIHGTGLMIGIGGATRYGILRSQKRDKRANEIFSTSIKLGVILGLLFTIVGVFSSESLALTLGADDNTLPLTKTYLLTILSFAPFFIMNNILLAFVRNDNNPRLSMVAMLTGSFSNIILDYIFMFPLQMGMFGAAFATGLAPIISILILTVHLTKGRNSLSFIKGKMKLSRVFDVFRLGLSSFISEISSAVVLITFNLVILKLAGNLGVASYGIVANIALVGISIFTGIAQGIQPLISKGYGSKNFLEVKKVMRYALITSGVIALIIYSAVFIKANSIVGIFNSEKNLEILHIAITGLRIYFIGFFFAGINIIMSIYLSATERAKDAFIVSMARGLVIIVPLVLILSSILKMTGVWLSFVFTELAVTIMTYIIVKTKKNIEREEKIRVNLAND
ncbi:MATE family efflux transporter [Alloiococcus sp. CFN-8]|uniref:MATE family efflux transporter n=1 Tax=Alloiococcus sp. CFN-8 TaxID=3416081 RepID=UPI003CEA632F